MEALTELCELIAKKPAQFADKLKWICSRCPSAEALAPGSPRISRSQLNAVLTVGRFLSQCPDPPDDHPQNAVLEFLRSISSSFRRGFWPQSFHSDDIASFYSDYFRYMSKAAELSSDFADEAGDLVGDVTLTALNNAYSDSDESGICRLFLIALSENVPMIATTDAVKLVTILLERVPDSFPLPSNGGGANSYQSSPASLSYFQANEHASPANGKAAGGGIVKQQVVNFEEETVESLEKQEVAFKLLCQILDKGSVDTKLLEQVQLVAKRQLQSSAAFLKIRKRDWTEHGQSLKARINLKLSTYRAAARLKIACLKFLDYDVKIIKRLLLETLALMIDAAEACLLSVWRKLRLCEELFSCLLSGVAHIAMTRGGQLLRVLLIRLKPVVLTACAQADTSCNSQGTMFDSALRTSCEIIEFGWSKDRAPVDTFILGLATCIRVRNDYDEEAVKEKPTVSTVQLSVIKLLADLNVSVRKTEVVDMILPLFIESLEEGEASTPGLLRLHLLDAVARLASLGFEKSYRESVVLLTRSYVSKLSNIGSAESKTEPDETDTERVERLF